MLRRTLLALFIGLAIGSAPARAGTLSELFLKVPAPPDDGAAAKTWMRDGRIAAPQFVEVDDSLRKERTAPVTGSPSGGADGPGVLVAVQGYERYRVAHSGDQDPVQVLTDRSAWIVKRFDTVRRKLGSRSVGDHNAVDDELRAWGALFRDWQSTRRALIEQGERDLLAAGDPAVIRDPGNAAAVRAYRAAMLHEIETALAIPRMAVERASAR